MITTAPKIPLARCSERCSGATGLTAVLKSVRVRHRIAVLVALAITAGGGSTSMFADQPAGPLAAVALGDAGPLQKITVETGRAAAGAFSLAGRDAAQQLLITGHYSNGQQRDLTRDVSYRSDPVGIVQISSEGYVQPASEGRAKIHIESSTGPSGAIEVSVTNLVKDLPVHFPNHVVPVFTKAGCNGGSCHGKTEGQNGFRLSLLGFEPTEDYEYLVKGSRGRRVSPAVPDQSLLLLKATGSIPHGGGHRFDVGSPAYQVLHRWIQQAMPYGQSDDPTISRIEVQPRHRLLNRQASQQLTVVAHYSDGATRDVTRMTQFESNDQEMANVSEKGLVTVASAPGSVAIMTRYQSQVDVFRATVPLGAPVESLPAPKNYIDELVFAKLKELGLPPSDPSDDSTFIRRVTIDICGRLPVIEEIEAFLADGDANKRERLVDRLLADTDYADYFANKWSAVLRNKRADADQKRTTYLFHAWIRESLHRNKPYDKFVREVLAASGEAGWNPPVAWYHQLSDPTKLAEDAAQLFLGLRIQCARCHHHPFETWSQQDYYGLSAYFSRVGRKPSEVVRGKHNIFHEPGVPTAQHPKTKQDVPPIPLGGEPSELDPQIDPRHLLVDWMVQPDNPYFARALVNRYWKHFFSRGLVDPEDDMRLTNPATHPALLDALAARFIESGYDLKQLVRTICTSNTYGLSDQPNQYNGTDKLNFSRYYPRRLHAEVLLDSIDRLTATRTRFAGVPLGTRAVQLPDDAFDSYFLTVFGRPDATSACECERSSDVNLAQCLHLLNSTEVLDKVNGARSIELSQASMEHADRIKRLYMIAFSRPPTPEESRDALAHIELQKDDAKRGYEDLIWVLINTREFAFNH